MAQKVSETPQAATKEATPRQAKKLAEDETTVIRFLKPGHQKKGASAERYKFYRDGMTVAEFLAAGGWREDIRFDSNVKRQHIRLERKRA